MTETSLEGIAVWNGRTFLGTRTVRWEGDRITAVDAADVDASAAGSASLSLIPGLVDTHVHLDTKADGSSADRSWPLITPPEERSLHAASHAKQAAKAGITTLRDLAAEPTQFAVSRAFEQGVLIGPRLYASGPVGMTAGHGDLFVPPFFPIRQPVADSPDECRKLVRSWARAGATGIKIYTSGGILSMGDQVGWRNQTRDEIRATIDEAHALGMLVAAHSHTAEGIDIALDDGADSIEHGTGMDDSHFVRLVERNIPVAPTLLINDAIASGAMHVPHEAQLKAQAVIGDRDARLRRAAAAGVRFVLGTDANGVFVRWGDQLTEVRKMAELFGWTAERALFSATADAADAIGIAGVTGSIAPGLGADFLVVEGRPWERIDALRSENIVAVVSRGRLVSGRLPG